MKEFLGSKLLKSSTIFPVHFNKVRASRKMPKEVEMLPIALVEVFSKSKWQEDVRKGFRPEQREDCPQRRAEFY